MSKPVDLGPDHRRRREERRHGRGPGQQVRGLRRLDQRASSPAPAARSPPSTDKGIDADASTSTPRPARGGRASSEKLRRLPRRARPTCRSRTEGTAGATFGGAAGAFMVNWTYIWTNYDETQPEVKDDLGFARYPQTVEGEESGPPYGGIGVGVSGVLRAHRRGDGRDRVHHQRRRTRASTPSSPATCRPARPATTTPRSPEIYPQELARPVPGEPRRGRAAHASRRTGATSRAGSRASGTRRASVDNHDPAGLEVLHRATCCTEGACCEHHRGRAPRPGAEDRTPPRQRTWQRPGPRGEPARAASLVAPAVIVMLLVTAWPMIQALYLSLFRYRLTNPGRHASSSASSNYGTVLTDPPVLVGHAGTPC